MRSPRHSRPALASRARCRGSRRSLRSAVGTCQTSLRPGQSRPGSAGGHLQGWSSRARSSRSCRTPRGRWFVVTFVIPASLRRRRDEQRQRCHEEERFIASDLRQVGLELGEVDPQRARRGPMPDARGSRPASCVRGSSGREAADSPCRLGRPVATHPCCYASHHRQLARCDRVRESPVQRLHADTQGWRTDVRGLQAPALLSERPRRSASR